MTDASSNVTTLRTEDLDYHLPPELIATRPAEPRDSARMLVMSRSHEKIEHRLVRDLPDYLRPGDRLVFNNTSVVPARLIGNRRDTGGRVEGLFVRECTDPNSVGDVRWLIMAKAGGRLRPGIRIQLLNRQGQPGGFGLELVEKIGAEWMARLEPPGTSTAAALDATGRTPLPPYILHARGEEAVADDFDRARYQTVYADAARQQSVAAPTAGLHFTPQLLAALASKGVERIDITLHVGLGTFAPVKAATLGEHRMHAEWFEVPAAAVEALRGPSPPSALSSRIIAVGSTSVRTLESLPHPLGGQRGQICGPIAGMTDLMIAPPHEFRLVDGMLTNFHLPRSTLLALVGAMVGLDRLKAVYRNAIQNRYRFFSYGDAMLIVP